MKTKEQKEYYQKLINDRDKFFITLHMLNTLNKDNCIIETINIIIIKISEIESEIEIERNK